MGVGGETHPRREADFGRNVPSRIGFIEMQLMQYQHHRPDKQKQRLRIVLGANIVGVVVWEQRNSSLEIPLSALVVCLPPPALPPLLPPT